MTTWISVLMQHVLDMIRELRGKPLSIATDSGNFRPADRRHLRADVSRRKTLIGWAPHSDPRRGLAELLAMKSIKLTEGPTR